MRLAVPRPLSGPTIAVPPLRFQSSAVVGVQFPPFAGVGISAGRHLTRTSPTCRPGRPRMSRSAARLVAWLVCLVSSSVASGQPGRGTSGESDSRVRAADAWAAELLEFGAARFVTFRRIVDAIERTDVIVYIETRPMRLAGALQLVAATAVGRYLRICVRAPGLESEQAAALAHELWHALEVGTMPEIRDQESLRRSYQRTGHGGRYSNEVESASASLAETTVLGEFRQRQ